MTDPAAGLAAEVLTWVVAFLVGASLARLITSDALPPIEALRLRWESHIRYYIDELLLDASENLPSPQGHTSADKMLSIRRQVMDRAVTEPPVRFWVRSQTRLTKRPWASTLARLERLESYQKFPTCSWCMPFWVFLAVGFYTWTVHLGAEGFVGVPVVFAFAARWVYGLVAR